MLSEGIYGTYMNIGSGLGKQARPSRPLTISLKSPKSSSDSDREYMLYKHHLKVNDRIRATIIVQGDRRPEVLFWNKWDYQ